MISRLKGQKGLTMVEVIVAAIILVIVAVAILGLYNNNFGWIINAGFKTRALDKARTTIDSKIAQGAANNSSSVNIVFGGGSTSITVVGELISATGTDGPGNKASVTLTSFLPYVSP